MIETLTIALRIAGAGLLLLALMHIPIGRRLKWREDAAQLTPINASIFNVHNFFICVVLVMMALPCVLDPMMFLEKSRAAKWVAWSFAGFWAIRLHFQLFVYRPDLWRGKRMETWVHYLFILSWIALTLLFALCGSVQAGWVS